jgi:hypothetical protein
MGLVPKVRVCVSKAMSVHQLHPQGHPLTWQERLLCILDVPGLCAAALGEEIRL